MASPPRGVLCSTKSESRQHPRQGSSFTYQLKYWWDTYHFKNTYSPITLGNISSINVVSIFRKEWYQVFFWVLIDLIIGFLGLIIKAFDNQTEISELSPHPNDIRVLFFVPRTASGSAQVRASTRHCHRPLRSSSVASLPPSPAAILKNLTIFFLFSERFGRLVTVIQGPGGAPGTRARWY
jgi:hypothetical protein